MRKLMIREGAIFALLLVTLSLLLHPDLLSDPGVRLSQMTGRGNYLHPLVYTLLVYFVVLLLRGVIRLFARLFHRNGSAD
ncbi:hypothetical protein LOH54_10205 [Sulfurimonas sp. HSL-3221]|uniref:hypothetical protein n=1 Tax=Sulfurimonadaceae TaxID=2771471 RepID=UPI001E62650F|nr:hypothetical protein [Sulfurimonas sp. HSL-3221]UFS62020.1 hypothetical protein LOH54_10205 [Sulfurimonas sp. HSL-3221]